MAKITVATRPSDLFLVGTFNGWTPGLDDFRFREVVVDGGPGEPPLETGSFLLEVNLPAGEVGFKVVEGCDWQRQWSVMRCRPDDPPYPITDHQHATRHGLAPCVIRFRGDGHPPHALLDTRGGSHRFDFHPASGTLTIHRDASRLPAPLLAPWRSFPCGGSLAYDTWVCLPYGYDAKRPFPYPLCLVFDSPNLLYGDDPVVGRRRQPATQVWRVADVLARHGVIAPPVLVGVGVPRPADGGGAALREEAFLGPLREGYVRSIVEELLPAVRAELATDPSREGAYLLGHSNGGDLALAVLARHPERFGGAVALSPGGADVFARRLEEPRAASLRSRVRVALTYSEHDLWPGFVTRTAGARAALARLGVPHLVLPLLGRTHDPASAAAVLPGLLAFVLP